MGILSSAHLGNPSVSGSTRLMGPWPRMNPITSLPRAESAPLKQTCKNRTRTNRSGAMNHSLKGCARGTDPTCPTVFRLGSVSGIVSPFLDIYVKTICYVKNTDRSHQYRSQAPKKLGNANKIKYLYKKSPMGAAPVYNIISCKDIIYIPSSRTGLGWDRWDKKNSVWERRNGD